LSKYVDSEEDLGQITLRTKQQAEEKAGRLVWALKLNYAQQAVQNADFLPFIAKGKKHSHNYRYYFEGKMWHKR